MKKQCLNMADESVDEAGKFQGRYFEQQSCDAQQECGAGAGMRRSPAVSWESSLVWLVLSTWVGQRSGDVPCPHLRLKRRWKESKPALPSGMVQSVGSFPKRERAEPEFQGRDGRGWSRRGDIHIPFFSKSLAKQNRERKASSSRE